MIRGDSRPVNARMIRGDSRPVTVREIRGDPRPVTVREIRGDSRPVNVREIRGDPRPVNARTIRVDPRPVSFRMIRGFHRRPPAWLVARMRSAAICTARTIRGYVPQRQTLRSITFAMSSAVGLGWVFSSPTVAMTMPGVQ